MAAGLDPSGVRLIRHYSNAVIAVPAEDAVARVATGPHDQEQVRRSVRITCWLADHGYPTVVPGRAGIPRHGDDGELLAVPGAAGAAAQVRLG